MNRAAMDGTSGMTPEAAGHLQQLLADPKKRLYYQQALALILHLYQCRRSEMENDNSNPCTVRLCQTIREVLTHQKSCQLGKNCPKAICSLSRDLKSHWMNCQRRECPLSSRFFKQQPKREPQPANEPEQVHQQARQGTQGHPDPYNQLSGHPVHVQNFSGNSESMNQMNPVSSIGHKKRCSFYTVTRPGTVARQLDLTESGPASSLMKDRQTYQLVQRQLMLLLHVDQCQRSETENDNINPCNQLHCRPMNEALIHMKSCQLENNCPTPHCSSARLVLTHWENCQRQDCPVCSYWLRNNFKQIQQPPEQPQYPQKQHNNLSQQCDRQDRSHPQQQQQLAEGQVGSTAAPINQLSGNEGQGPSSTGLHSVDRNTQMLLHLPVERHGHSSSTMSDKYSNGLLEPIKPEESAPMWTQLQQQFGNVLSTHDGDVQQQLQQPKVGGIYTGGQDEASGSFSVNRMIAAPLQVPVHNISSTIVQAPDPSNMLDERACNSVALATPASGEDRRHPDRAGGESPEAKRPATASSLGEGCVEKPLATLWRNYTQNSKPDVLMKLCLCPSGLKATTRQHGLTEYWSHRITYCTAPKNYPRVFCWIYRHEGRKLKHEFRCHAVICSKESVAKEISTTLKENLAKALQEFKRDKLNRQNARLSLANSVYDNPSMPRRKIMLSVGANNYRPPLERSKSAPKLMAIEEMIAEEDEEEAETPGAGKSTSKSQGDEMRACCKEDSLFPSTTLGRRRCRRGHSIRRSRLRNSFKSPKAVEAKVPLKNENVVQESPMNKSVDSILDTIKQEEEDEHLAESEERTGDSQTVVKAVHHSDSSEDDFETFLMNYNYNSKEPLSSELISYLDTKLSPKVTASMHDLSSSQRNDQPETGRRLEDVRLALSLDDLDNYDEDTEDHEDTEDDVFFNKNDVLEILRSTTKSANSYTSGGAPCGDDDTAPPSLLCVTNKISGNSDSDEGSISSGCETSSTVTTNTDESAAAILIKPCSVLERVRSFEQLAEHPVIHEPIGEKTPLGKHHHDTTIFKRSITFPAPGVKTSFLLPVSSSSIVHEEESFHEDPLDSLTTSPTPSSMAKPSTSSSAPSARRLKSTVAAVNTELINHLQAIDSDSDLSDESGYVEFQDHQPSIKSVTA